MIGIKRITINELDSLVSSLSYPSWEVIPISRHRAKSYIQNPRCLPNDVILYLAFADEKLVGYRTVLPDWLLSNGEVIRVCWLSGVWVNPEFRRQGIASDLLQAVLKDWEDKVLCTNFTNSSKAVFTKTTQFVQVASLSGIRLYLCPCLARILPPRGGFYNKLRPIWQMVDCFLSILSPMPFLAKRIKTQNVDLTLSESVDDVFTQMFEELTRTTPTGRSKAELNWITEYPWLVAAPLGDAIGQKYFFSSAPKQFEQMLVKVYEKKNSIGFYMVNNVDGFLSTPYIFCPQGKEKLFARIILKQSAHLNCKRITTYHEPIALEMAKMIPFCWLTIPQKREFFATKALTGKYDNSPRFLEGDGDCAFV